MKWTPSASASSFPSRSSVSATNADAAQSVESRSDADRETLPPSMLHHRAICLAKERRQICQTDGTTTILASVMKPGFRMLGARDKGAQQ